MDFVKNIIYFILNLQEKILRARLKNTINAKNNSKRKKYFQDGCLLSLESVADEEKNKMEGELSLILKQADYEPEKLLEYIKLKGTGVYYIKNPKALYSVGENEGFIYPQDGLKAAYLSLLTGRNFVLKTDEMFILSKGNINKFYFIYHLYNWYAYKHGISGVDSDSVFMLNKYLFNATDEEINKLPLADIYKLKDAIKQDKDAIEFVFKLCKDLEGAKNAFLKLTENGTSI
jgi:hypothetical protein